MHPLFDLVWVHLPGRQSTSQHDVIQSEVWVEHDTVYYDATCNLPFEHSLVPSTRYTEQITLFALVVTVSNHDHVTIKNISSASTRKRTPAFIPVCDS